MPIRRPDHGCHGYSSSRNSVLWAFSSLVVQHDQAPRLNRIQATSTRGVRARIRRVAGCATPTGSAGHAGATANLKLTFHPDHSAGADHCASDPWRVAPSVRSNLVFGSDTARSGGLDAELGLFSVWIYGPDGLRSQFATAPSLNARSKSQEKL